MNPSPNPGWRPTVEGMTPADRDHYARITTLRGSVVTIPNLTEQQAQAIADQHGPAERPALTADKKKTTCSRCQGAGGWEEEVRTKSSGGSEVVTKKWVNCRPCGGTGQV